jgi:2-methylcitrate dehydratase PrpD
LASNTADMTATKAISRFAATLSCEDIPERTQHTVKRIILDCIGTGLAATTLGEGCQEAIAVACRFGGAAESSILGISTKVSAIHAAFANGALVHALNYDPIGAEIGHIGVACLPAPLALAEAIGGVPGRNLIAAATVSCEVTARVTAAISRTGRRPSEKFLSGQLLTHFGAAAGAGRILGLNADAMESALGLALMQMSGSRQIVLSGDPPAKAIYGAFPNQAGVMAAMLAKEGLDAKSDVFGPPAGLYAAIYGGECDTAILTENLGGRFLLDDTEFKPWPSSNQVHPFIEASLDIAGRLGIAAITSIEIVCHSRLRPWCEPAERRQRPDNAAAAADSVQFCVAVALVEAEVTLTSFSAEGLNNPNVLALASRVTIRFDDTARGASVSVRTKTGEHLTSHVEAPLGSHSRPIGDNDLQKKFRDCCRRSATPLHEDRISQLIDVVYGLDKLDNVAVLADLACGRKPIFAVS